MANRRSFILGLGALLVAPAIVRAASIMPVRPFSTGLVDIDGMELFDFGNQIGVAGYGYINGVKRRHAVRSIIRLDSYGGDWRANFIGTPLHHRMKVALDDWYLAQ